MEYHEHFAKKKLNHSIVSFELNNKPLLIHMSVLMEFDCDSKVAG